MILLTEQQHPGALALPIADRANVAFAVGLAIGGQHPVVELSSTGRVPAVLEPLAEAASVAAAGEFQVPLVVRIPYGGQAGDRVDRPAGDLLAAIDGLTVLCASNAAQAAGLRAAAEASGRPTVLLEPRNLTLEGDAAPASTDARVLREGDHLTLVTWGPGVSSALHAAEMLAGEGLSIGVVDLVSLNPLDRDTLRDQVRHTGRILVVHPHDAGLAERVLRAALHEAFEYLESPPATCLPAQVAAAARDSIHW